MSLINGSTRWVLFLGSGGQSEDRHILDLAFGLQCLESAGVNLSNIFIYVDGPNRTLISQLISNGSKNPPTTKETAYFFSDLDTNDHENLVMFITGHGGIDGIEAPTPITPYALLGRIKSTPKLKHAIIYLGQCHAGIFNYIGAGRKNKDEPEVILVGATNLHESISSNTKESLASGDASWIANIFLLHLFKWISNPVDVDGDGRRTVIDSYKYAGALSNNSSKSMKMGTFINSFDLHRKWETAKEDYKKSPSLQAQLNLQAAEDQYAQILGVRYIHQECWILNAIPAQHIEF
ncbi:hypothetical protein D3C78_1042860 [compost metagenome]